MFNVSKHTTLLGGVDVGPPKCGRGSNGSIHENMNDISNAKIYLKTRSENVNIYINARTKQAEHFISMLEISENVYSRYRKFYI